MSTALMIAMTPESVRRLLNGEKSCDLRKVLPTARMPMKCYIYETKPGCGKVIGEFICNEIRGVVWFSNPIGTKYEDDWLECGMTAKEAWNYTKGKDCGVLEISEFKEYGSPLHLYEFRKPCKDKYGYCDGCEYGLIQYPEDAETIEDCQFYKTRCLNFVRHAPQNFMYVEEFDDDD